MSRRPLSDQRHLLVELELDDATLRDLHSSPLRGQQHPRHQHHGRAPPTVRTARPQSATVRRTPLATATSATSDRRTQSPYKLKQRVLSSRSRAPLLDAAGDDGDDGDWQQQQPPRRTSARPQTYRANEPPPMPSPVLLIAGAIRQNIAQRNSVLLDVQDELRQTGSSAAAPLDRPRSKSRDIYSTSTRQPPLLASKIIKTLNKLRSLTLSTIEMIQYFHDQIAASFSNTTTTTGDAMLWALRHEFQDFLLRLCASDVDCLLSSSSFVYAFESLGVGVLRNPLLDGVALDSSELLLCSCQSMGGSAVSSSSSLFQLAVRRLEAFALEMRQTYPSWQVLPQERVARALLLLVETETKANATRMLPSYLRSSREGGEEDERRYRSQAHRQSTAVAASGCEAYGGQEQEEDEEEAFEEMAATPLAWADDTRSPQAAVATQRTSSSAPLHSSVQHQQSPQPHQPPVEVSAPQPPIATRQASRQSISAALSPEMLPVVAEPKPVTEPVMVDAARPRHQAKKNTHTQRIRERSKTVVSLLPTSPRLTSEPIDSVARPLAVREHHCPQATANAPPTNDDDGQQRTRATIASALDKLPQFSLHRLGILATGRSPIEEERLVEQVEHEQTEEENTEEAATTALTGPCTTPSEPLMDRVVPPPSSHSSTVSVNEDEDVTTNSAALSHILSLCRDVQVAAIDLNQRLHPITVSAPSSPLATLPSLGSPGGRRVPLPLSSRYLERELKMLRRCFRLWTRSLMEKHLRANELRVACAARLVGRFGRHVLAQRAAKQRLCEQQQQSQCVVMIQCQWRLYCGRQQVKKRQASFQLMHQRFRRFCFFVRVTQGRRRHQEAQQILRNWFTQLAIARRKALHQQQVEGAIQKRRAMAASQLAYFMREQTLRHQLSKALESNRSMLMNKQLMATQARREDAKRKMLEEKRHREMKTVMQQTLHEMETKWRTAECEKQRLVEETRQKEQAEALRQEHSRRRLAKEKIHRFLESAVFRRRLGDATRAISEIASAKTHLENVRLRMERQHKKDRAQWLLHSQMTRWKMDKVVEKERLVAIEVVGKMERESILQREEDSVKLVSHVRATVAASRAAAYCGQAQQAVLETTYRSRLEAKQDQALQLYRQAARERIAGFVLHWMMKRALEKSQQATLELKQSQNEREEAAKRQHEEAMAAEALKRRHVSSKQISKWLVRQLSRQQKKKQQAEEQAARLLVKAEQARLDRARQRMADKAKRKQQQRLIQEQAQQQLGRERMIREALVDWMLTTTKIVERTTQQATKNALFIHHNECERLLLERTLASIRVRSIERKVGRRWWQFTLRRRTKTAITKEALWPATEEKSGCDGDTDGGHGSGGHGYVSVIEASTEAVLEESQRRELRLYELKCIASARKLQRCWRAWRRRVYKQKRLLAKTHEDELVATAKRQQGQVATENCKREAVRASRRRQIISWLTRLRRDRQLQYRVAIQANGNGGMTEVRVYFAGGRAWLSPSWSSCPQVMMRRRMDRNVTRKLLDAMDPVIHTQDDVVRLLQELVLDAQPILQQGTNEPVDDIGESELPRFKLVMRQLSKTRSIVKRKRLLDAKATESSSGAPCLTIWDAVDHVSIEDAQFLLQQGVDLISAREPLHQRSALHMLAFSGSGESSAHRVQMLRFLIDRAKLDVHARDADGNTPLMLFAGRGALSLVDEMLVTEPLLWQEADVLGRNALHHACDHDHLEVATAIQKHVMASSERPLEAALLELHRGDVNGVTPLHTLAARGHLECMKQLLVSLDSGSDRTTYGRILHQSDSDGRTPLHIAVTHGDLGITRLLLCHGVDVSIGDQWQRQPLHYATRASDAVELISLLAEQDATDLQAADARGDTSLHWAAASGRASVVKHLLALGADPHALNNDWESPAQVAAMGSHSECVRLLQPAPTSGGRGSNRGGCEPLLILDSHHHQCPQRQADDVHDRSNEVPSPKSYYHPSGPTSASRTRDPPQHQQQQQQRPTMKGGEYDWNEIHQGVEIVEETGHFSSEEEEQGDTNWSDDDDDGDDI